MPKTVIIHVVLLFLMGCTVQGSQINDSKDEEDVVVVDTPNEELPVPEQQKDNKNYDSYDCSNAWETFEVEDETGIHEVTVPIPCDWRFTIDKGYPLPIVETEFTSRTSKQ